MPHALLGEVTQLPLALPHALPHALAQHQATQPDASHKREKTVLVLSASAGAGHVRAAQAICAQADLTGMPVTARHVDVLDYVSTGIRQAYTSLYLRLIERHPLVWSYVYHKSHALEPRSLLDRLRCASERWSATRLLRLIDELRPDAIVCTHFLPAGILAYHARRGRLAAPIWVQITDFDLHRMWLHEGVKGYFAGNAEVGFRLQAQGVMANAIHVTGIPVMPAFAHSLSRAACAQSLGIDSTRPTLLLMGGGAGLGRLEQLAARLLRLPLDFQLIALAGRNVKSLILLQELAERHPQRLLALGYTEQVHRLMACSDLAITKPGGLTTAECLAMGLPMILNQPIPGQEERNADFLLEQGVALKASDAAMLEYRVLQLLTDPGRLQQMRARAQALRRPAAARDVMRTVLGLKT